jgi:S-DNA-T family DNA segregation ATPase FtsK/SpoIIIE
VNDKPTLDQRLDTLRFKLWNLWQIAVEIWKGFARQDEALFQCLIVGLTAGVMILCQLDVWLFKHTNIWRFYPRDGWMFRVYVLTAIWLPVLGFGVWVRNDKKKFAQKLKEVFDLVGLKNAIGSYPHFLSLEPITGGTMKLRLTNGAFPLGEWQKRKERLEANMRVFIDEIKQVPDKGIIEMTFSYEPMPTKVTIENIRGFRDYKFLIGRDRMKSYTGDFSTSPHLLAAGETGGGKSAFMRQLITTIKLNQPEAEFHLVDLKGGVEFGHFESFPGMKVISEVSSVAAALKTITGNLKLRSQALKDRRLTKIEEFFATDEFRKLSPEARTSHILGRRVFVVVDECAEIFLFGLGHDASHTREIRGCMSTIARLGRFVGVHVILGTQRPDKQAVDPQVKTNMTSTICFRIHDHGGSLAVLGTGRATDLPKLPGRAILRTGADELEIQTPLLEFGEAMKLLEEKFKATPDHESKQTEVDNGKSDKPTIQKVPEPDSLK